MSTTRNILQHGERYDRQFRTDFGFFLDALDEVLFLQTKVGLEAEDLADLAESDARRFKAALFLVESANTTTIALLRLLSGNLHSDAYSLLRILYEVASLLHYAAGSIDNSQEVHDRFFDSGLPDDEHARGEWRLVQKAQREWEAENPDLPAIRQLLNNYGSHISRAKMVLGNVTAIEHASASTFFTPNYGAPEFLRALDMLFALAILVVEQYDQHSVSFRGAAPSVQTEVARMNKHFLSEVRPRLQKMQMGRTS